MNALLYYSFVGSVHSWGLHGENANNRIGGGRLGIVDLGLEKIAFWDFGLPRPHFYQEKLPKLPTLCIIYVE